MRRDGGVKGRGKEMKIGSGGAGGLKSGEVKGGENRLEWRR